MPVYLDYNATTPLRPEAREAMGPFWSGVFGNPSSIHGFGQEARVAVDRARGEIAALIGAAGGTLVFTGSGTEAVLTALTSGARLRRGRGEQVVVSGIEHAAGVAGTAMLRADGFSVREVSPDSEGRIEVDRIRDALGEETVLVSLLHANNETGVIQPVEEVAAFCREREILFHVDAAQSAGKIPVSATAWGADLVSLTAHKLGGPKGVGALWIRPGLRVPAMIPGSQEGGVRGGTVNVPGIVGFGAAAVAAQPVAALQGEMLPLRRRLEVGVTERVPGAVLTAESRPRLANTAHFTFAPEVGGDLVPALDMAGYAVSAGSACASGSEEPSHVLLAMGMKPERARTAVRVSLGSETTATQIDGFVNTLARVVGSLNREIRT